MTALAQAGGVAGTLGLATLMLASSRGARLVGFGGWAAGAALLAYALAPHGHRSLLVGAAVLGLLGAALAAVVFALWPWALAFAALALVPARVFVSVGDASGHLLLPLYGVVGGAALALGWALPGEERRARELGPVAWPLALWTAWTGLSILWADDVRRGAIELLLWVLPFGLLAVALARLPWSVRGLGLLYGELALMAVVLAGVGLYQWATRDVFWSQTAAGANAFPPAFRVESVFPDPSAYGRFLAVAILAGAVVVLARPPVRVGLAAAAAVAATWAGLYYAFSPASLGALLAGLAVAALVAWRRRAALAAAALVVAAAAVALAAPGVRHTVATHARTDWHRVAPAAGGRVFLDHPALGVGVGSFPRARRDTPVAVAAETGVPGLALLAWLVAAALAAALRPGRRGFAARASAAFGIMLTAIVVHSAFHANLFSDPVFWGLLGLTAVASRARRPAR